MDRIAHSGTNALRILLVEDSKAEAVYIERTLMQATPYAYRIKRVADIASAKDALEAADFDVVLLDLGLPDVVGFSGLQALQDLAPKVPIVILTSRDDRETELSAMENGAQDYMLKDKASVSALNRSMLHAIQRKQIENMKSEFISLVSHELRTPITAIHGALGLIAGDMETDLPQQVSHLVNIANKNSERLIRLINDILDIDKIDAAQMYYEMKPEPLMLILQQAAETNAVYAARLGVKVWLEPSPEVTVNVDSKRLAQVMANLLSNAAKYSPSGSTVTISVQSQPSGRVRVNVSDQGPGIREDFRAHIFQKFSQADDALTRTKQGAGLGLYICKRIIEHMRGSIGFDSAAGHGATFWFELPEPETRTVRETNVIKARAI
ncbi:MAG: hybrid sensor histidine kinase/response regulator [Asticcacaulis sp.]|uniref:sensor histidine kinase n=1 Tax=Asticcacaulis sp. TaxID=1872648 RepID=UPI0039E700F9